MQRATVPVGKIISTKSLAVRKNAVYQFWLSMNSINSFWCILSKSGWKSSIKYVSLSTSSVGCDVPAAKDASGSYCHYFPPLRFSRRALDRLPRRKLLTLQPRVCLHKHWKMKAWNRTFAESLNHLVVKSNQKWRANSRSRALCCYCWSCAQDFPTRQGCICADLRCPVVGLEVCYFYMFHYA